MNKYTIIIFNMSYWQNWQNGIRNRNYFVLHELLQRSSVKKIIAVDYLPVSFKQKTKILVRRIKKCKFKTNNLIQCIDKKLSICSVARLKTLQELIQKKLQSSIKKGHKIIMWSYFPLYIDYFDYFNVDIKVFDCVDNWIHHPAYKKQKQLLQYNYQQIAKKADIVFTVSDNLRTNLFNSRKNIFWIPNGVPTNFACMCASKHQNKKIKVGYIGTIQSRVDFDLVRHIALQHQNKEFVFVGPIWKDAETSKVKDIANINFMGRVAYSNIKDYLSKFDIGIIPHKTNEFTYSMNPMKFYEYLACGLPVVSTQKIIDDTDLLYFADSKVSFSNGITKVLNKNSQQLALKRQNFAKQNSWSSRVGKMMKILKKY